MSTPAVRVRVGSESYVFSRDELTLSDLYAIKSATGLTFNAFSRGVEEGDPQALQGLVWFCRHKAGIQGDPLQIDFKLGDFTIDAVEDADPTVASSGSSDAATSEDSPTTAI